MFNPLHSISNQKLFEKHCCNPRIPKEKAIAIAQQNLIDLLPSTFSFSPASQTNLQLHLDEHLYSEVLLQQSVHDRAHFLALSDSSGLACA